VTKAKQNKKIHKKLLEIITNVIFLYKSFYIKALLEMCQQIQS